MAANNLSRFLQTDNVKPYKVRRSHALFRWLLTYARAGWAATAFLVLILAAVLAGYYTHLTAGVVVRCIP